MPEVRVALARVFDEALLELARLDAVRVPVEIPGLEQRELARRTPLALVVRVPDLAARRRADARGRSSAFVA